MYYLEYFIQFNLPMIQHRTPHQRSYMLNCQSLSRAAVPLKYRGTSFGIS